MKRILKSVQLDIIEDRGSLRKRITLIDNVKGKAKGWILPYDKN